VEFGTGKKLGSLTMKEIETRDWDIRPMFQNNTLGVSKNIYHKLSDICTMEKGTIQASKSVEGPYKCYSGAKEVATHNEYMFEGSAIIYVNGSSGSLGRVHFANEGEKFAATTLVYVLKPKIDLNIRYVYHYLRLNKKSILETFKSSNMRQTIQIEDLSAYKIPIPPLSVQELIVANLDRIFTNPDDTTDILAFTTKAMDLMLKDPTGATLEDIISGLRMKRAYLASADLLNSQMASVMRSVSMRGYDQKAIQDVCDYKNGATLDKAEKNDDGQYNVMGGGMDYVGKYNKFNREGYTITISKSGASAGFVKEHSDKFWAGDCFSIYPKSDLLEYKYLYNIICQIILKNI
jgi:type I restriction enzyme S subunit